MSLSLTKARYRQPEVRNAVLRTFQELIMRAAKSWIFVASDSRIGLPVAKKQSAVSWTAKHNTNMFIVPFPNDGRCDAPLVILDIDCHPEEARCRRRRRG